MLLRTDLLQKTVVGCPCCMYTQNTVHKMKQLFGSGKHRVSGRLNPIFLERSSLHSKTCCKTIHFREIIKFRQIIKSTSVLQCQRMLVYRTGPPFYLVILPREGLAVRRAKAIPSFSVTVRP